MADQLWKRAEHDLCIRVAGSGVEPVVWEHSSRVARITEAICSLPEVKSPSIDRAALQAASLYHDSAWVLQAQSGEIRPAEMLLRPTSDLQRDMSADWMIARLEGLVGIGVIATAARIIRQCNDRRTDLTEAQVLAEAENLDEVGPTAACTLIRRKIADGRTLADVVSAWERQEEYHYWEARVKDSFRFPSVLAVAERRLGSLRQFMQALRECVRVEDISALAMTQALSSQAIC